MRLRKSATLTSFRPEKRFRGPKCANTLKRVSQGNQPNTPQPKSWLVDVARVELARGIVENFDRILDHLANYQIQNAAERIGEIITALDVLELNPLIGRRVANGTRELVIGRRSKGYLALYRYVPEMDIVFVLAIRSQREAGYIEREEGTSP